MPLATWLRSQFTTQDPATYKAAIDGNFAVLERVAAMFAPSQQAVANMTVLIRAGSILDTGALVEVAAQTTAAFSAPATNSRIDRIVLDERTGVYSVVTGTPSATPVAPAIPVGAMPCAQVLLSSTSTAITNAMITDERVFGSASDAYIDALFAPKASPAFTGIPTAPTATPNTNSTQLATTAYVDAAAAAAGMPSTTRMPFNQTAAPTGWTKDTTAALNDTAMRIVTGAVGSGGANAFSTAAYTPTISTGTGSLTADSHILTINEIPSHTHTNASATLYSQTFSSGNAYAGNAAGATGPAGGGAGHTHTVSGAPSATSSTITLNLKYNDFIIATKN